MFSLSYIKLAIYAAVFAAGAYASWYVMDARLARELAIYEQERLEAVERALETEKAFRAVEQSWQSDVAAAVAAGQAAIALRDNRIAALSATNSKLSNRIAAIARDSQAAPDTAATIANFRHQIGILRLVVGELDDFAGEAVKAADAYRDELMLCRNYVKALHDTPSF